MTHTLLTIFPDPKDLLAVEPEDLGGIVLEIAPGVMQNEMFRIDNFIYPLYPGAQTAYPLGSRREVMNALAEAISWLLRSGLIFEDPEQPVAAWYRLTRRAQALKTRTDVEQFRKGRILPIELLQPALAEKVWPLFLRGDHDVAVVQAFKMVEVAVRKAANAKSAGYPDDLVGTSLMQEAFNVEKGPLMNPSAPAGEKRADMFLFAGAMGSARNPIAHHDRNVPAQDAARLIVFASYLLNILEGRASS
jgi:uncharacterized protein (TIGR02391 family)